MHRLTDGLRDDLEDLKTRLEACHHIAQRISMNFPDDDIRGDDFHYCVELKIEGSLDEIDGLLTEVADA